MSTRPQVSKRRSGRRASRAARLAPPIWLAWWWLVAGGAAPAGADELSLNLRTVGQGYQTRTVAGDLLDRRRITQWASLGVARLFDHDGLGLDVQLRFDTDLGLTGDPQADAAAPIELLAASLRAERLLGRLDVVLGRQLALDAVDFCLFDGLRLDLRLPLGFGLRLMSGLQVRDRTWLGGRVLEADGVERSQVPAPVVAAGVFFRRRWLAVELAYRRVVLWTGGWPLDDERLAAQATTRLAGGKVGLDAGLAYDLLADRVQRFNVDAFGRLPWPDDGLRLEVGGQGARPHFSFDSIFLFFSPAPFWQVQAGLRWDTPRAWAWPGWLRLAYYHRGYQATDDPVAPAVAGARVDGAELDARLRVGRAGAGWLWLAYEDGAAGLRLLVAPGLRWDLVAGVLDVEGRAVVAYVDDDQEDRFDATTVGGSAGLRWVFGPGRAVLVTAELNGSRVNPLRFRLLAVLDLAFVVGLGEVF